MSISLEEWGVSALSSAVSSGDLEFCTLLLSKGADVNLEGFSLNGVGTKKHDGVTPAILALFSKHPDVAEMLLIKGAQIRLNQTTRLGTEQSLIDKLEADAKIRLLQLAR